MKKVPVFILSLTLAALTCGCGNSGSQTTTSNASTTPAVENNSQEDAESASSSAPSSTITKAEQDNDSSQAGLIFPKKASIDSTTIYDANNVKITVDQLEYQNDQAVLDLTIENHTDKDLSFVTGSMGYSRNSVNGYMMDGVYLNETVNAGLQSKEVIRLDSDYLACAGISDIADITLDFQIEDADNNTFAETGPLVIKTNLADAWDYGNDTYAALMKSGQSIGESSIKIEQYNEGSLFDQNGVRIPSSALLSYGDEKLARLEVENTTESNIVLSVDDIAVNGITITSGTWTREYIISSHRGFIDLAFSTLLSSINSDALGINDINAISFTVQLKDWNDNKLGDPAKVDISFGSGEASSFDDSGQEVYNQNGIQIISKGISKGQYSYDENLHLLFVIKNTTSKELFVSVDSDSISVNDTMIDSLGDYLTVPVSAATTADVSLDSDSLARSQINSAEDIKKASLKFELQDENFTTIDEPVINLTF